MALYYYDTALLEKLKYWTNKTQVKVYGPDETRQLFEIIADETDDKPIKLPILCLRRNGGYTIININKKPMTFDGAIVKHTDENSTQFNSIPILINYQLDIYAKYLQEADALTRNLIFNIVNYPTMKIQIPYDSSNYLIHYSNVRVGNVVQDNSAIPERMVPGLFTRLSLVLDIDDAYLWDVRTKDNAQILHDVTLEIANPQDDGSFVKEKWKF